MSLTVVSLQSPIGLKISQITTIESTQPFLHHHSSCNFLVLMRPFKRPSILTPHYHQCLHRNSSTATTARQRPKVQKGIDQSLRHRANVLRTRIREARVARREDWILGPLAPRRDKGDNAYGTISLEELRPLKGGLGRAVLTERGRGGARIGGRRSGKGKVVGMSWTESLIYEGDRVAILSDKGPESREFGKIGTVSRVRRVEREVEIEDMNLVGVLSCSC